ncbi:MAG: InlB B-repeat-containing protein [Candidatus Coproplasma sp.]
MKCLKNKSIIAAGLTALSALALGVGVISSGTATGVGPEFIGSYNLTAYAEESSSSSVDRITVAGKEVDFISSAQFLSDNGDYALCLTVIDMADFGADFTASLQVGYEIAEDLFFNGNDSGLSNVVYSSLTFANGSLSVSDLSLSDSFKLPYFIVAEVPVININNEIFNFIVAEKHNTEPVSGQAATCTVDGWKDYYVCVDDNKYFTDSWGLHEIADLEAWKTGDGKIGAFGHTEVTEEAIAATCTEAGLTEGKHCSVCGEVLVAQSEVKALGHTYLDGYEDEYCTVCNDHKEVVKTVNGVNYTLAYDTESGVSRYFIASGKAEDFNALYTGDGAQTLVLENEIDGFPVTEIAESAFANTDGNPIKSVIIPANITKVNNYAFLDNYGIESAVFLADTVYVTGSFKEGEEGNNTPFYGCSTESGGTKTEMAIYFNTVIYNGSSTDLRWTRLRRFEASWLIYHRHFIGNDPSGSYNYGGGGTLYSNALDNYANWSYVDLTVNNNTADAYDFESVVKGYVTEGLNPEKIYNAEDIRSSVQSELDVLSTNEEKCLKYQVTVESFKDAFGTTQIVVNVDQAETVYYLITLTSATVNDNGDAVGGISVTGDYKEYNDAIYAANVTLTSDEVTGYQFGKFVCNGVEVGKDSYNFTLNSVCQVSVYYDEKPITINVISAVPFAHSGSGYESSATGVEVSISKDNSTILPTAEGYVFLGWAQKVGESLEFTAIGTEDGATYYAIWGVNNNSSVNVYSSNQSGTLPQDLTATDGTFYKWYADAAFSTEVSAVSAQNTVLYARWQYTLNVTGTVTSSYYSKEITINNTKQESYSLTVLEGIEIYIYESEVSKVYYIYQYNQDTDDTMIVNEMRIKTKSSWTASNTTKDVTVSIDGIKTTDFGSENRIAVSSSLNVNINY